MIFKILFFIFILIAYFLFPYTQLKHVQPPIKVEFEKSENILSFQSKSNLTLYYRKWGNFINPKAVILAVHGLGEGFYRYNFVGESFAKNNYAYVMMDLQGHGISEGDRCYIEKYQDWIQDVNDFIDDFYSKHSKLSSIPKFIFGHSMGGLISSLTALTRQSFFNGMILSAPAYQGDPKVATPFLVTIAKYLSKILPKLPVGDKINPKDVSRSLDIQTSYASDKYTYHRGLKANLGYQFILATNLIQESFNRFELPYLIMHGTQDKLVMIEGTERMFKESKSKDKEKKIYEGLYHELLNEPEKEQVMNDILNWLSKRVK